MRSIDELKPLLVRPLATKPGENLTGLIARVSQMNSWDKITWINEFLDDPFPQVSLSDDTVRRLSILFSLPEQALSAMQPGTPHMVAGQRVCSLNGIEVPYKLLVQPTHRRICPACLAEDVYHRGAWDFRFVRTCPRHRIRLIDTCKCGTQLHWRTFGIDVCRPDSKERKGACDHNLKDSIQEAVPLEQLQGQQFLVDQVSGQGRDVPELLADLNLGLMATVLDYFGHLGGLPGFLGRNYREEFPVEMPQRRYTEDSTDVRLELQLTVGLLTVKAGPERLLAALVEWGRAGKPVGGYRNETMAALLASIQTVLGGREAASQYAIGRMLDQALVELQ